VSRRQNIQLVPQRYKQSSLLRIPERGNSGNKINTQWRW